MGQKGEDAARAEEDSARALYLNKCVGGLGRTSRSEIASLGRYVYARVCGGGFGVGVVIGRSG